jgi:hypothetical protein
VTRRQFFKAAFVAAAALLLSGHTPYKQWVVYRKKHLLIGCHKADQPTYELAKRVAMELAEHLPESMARVARAPDARRLASLLGTGQMDVAILSRADAVSMFRGIDGFEPYGPTELSVLIPIGDRVLVARSDFPRRHAWLVTGTLADAEFAPPPDSNHNYGVPWHPGSLDFLQGRPEPESG